MQNYLEVSKSCKDFSSLKNEIEKFLNNFNYSYEIIIPPHVNESDKLPPYYSIPCYIKRRMDKYAVFIDLYVEAMEPVSAILIKTEDLFEAQAISQRLSLYLMN